LVRAAIRVCLRCKTPYEVCDAVRSRVCLDVRHCVACGGAVAARSSGVVRPDALEMPWVAQALKGRDCR
jgi:hypothetical protein